MTAFRLGDSLGAIASRELGDPTRFRELAELNGLDIFSQIPINTELKIPTAAELERIAREQLGSVLERTDLSGLATAVNGQSISRIIKLVDWLY